MDFRKINFTPGFTLLELLIVIILIGLISTIVITNTSFLDQQDSDEIESYKEFINFLSEESALTKKTIAWFISENNQSINHLQNNNWDKQDYGLSYYPTIKSNTLFKDSDGKSFIFSEERRSPFLIFYPSGQSSGGYIQLHKSNSILTLTIDTFGQVLDSENHNVFSQGF